ncbi:hypothetical protein ERICIV_00727 [Paenibacillus larvae subsp. larvae]|uniref:Lipoprotein n=1 Tax=Paenibacillus larvae subsp. larvae TaxID=147375 RepID=A0A2L1U9V3_9BACL|nr:hypothetical protein [Paenibacillus larvae]AQT85564.1 hypothetical protein B1222_15995 [Paenibacillus larvae subsp. pulvifaciens]AQZ47576.1 hypothetical protein B5S25_14310 [Paenibacillus larvae subsp. pulvifaciens]AVF24938.1 hypothetical protein ERICIII_00725 [Paenibacillus larvae subsp. larvae]AVF29701.1 hypothetical protein ERICIV_00727 [Paenibacillus larvae subsp. larvae]MBH0341275.1 hypothetical protein [Paenibacillus larvae]
MKRLTLLLLRTLVLVPVLMAGCGGKPKHDVVMFMMGSSGFPVDIVTKLETSLKEKVGEDVSLSISASPMYASQKLEVEIAAGGNGILVLPEKEFRSFAAQNSLVSLDDLAGVDDFPGGIEEAVIEPENKKQEPKPEPLKEKHLYAVPLDETKWFRENELSGLGLYAMIPVNAPDIEKAKAVMRKIAEKE